MRKEKKKMPELIIRKMVDTDVSRVGSIERETFSHPWSEDSFFKALNKEENIYLVACIEEKIVGYAGVFGAGVEGDVCNVAVDVSYRGRQIGKRLVEALTREADERKIEKLFLEVRSSNSTAISLYEKTGFVYIGERKGYYTDPCEDAKLYVREREM